MWCIVNIGCESSNQLSLMGYLSSLNSNIILVCPRSLKKDFMRFIQIILKIGSREYLNNVTSVSFYFCEIWDSSWNLVFSAIVITKNIQFGAQL